MNNRTLAVIWISVLGTLLLIGGLLYLLRPQAHPKATPSKLPASVLSQLNGFTAYYPQPLPSGFSLEQSSPVYTDGLLTYRLINGQKQAITITEQTVPDSLTQSSIIGKETLPNDYGTATISLIEGRTVGYLITKDKRVLIILNTADPVDGDSFKNLVRSLRPL